ncbi:MAG: hypothetical protein FWG28_07015, partial [Clostridiales bacterium]|nr:hypothetical protein [Clostridiales bacterium]
MSKSIAEYLEGELITSEMPALDVGEFTITLTSVDGGYSVSIPLRAPDYFFSQFIRSGKYWVNETPDVDLTRVLFNGVNVEKTGGRYQIELKTDGGNLTIENKAKESSVDDKEYGKATVAKQVNGSDIKPGDGVFTVRLSSTEALYGEYPKYSFFLDSLVQEMERQIPIGTYRIEEEPRAGFEQKLVEVKIMNGTEDVSGDQYVGGVLTIKQDDEINILVNNETEPAKISLKKYINNSAATGSSSGGKAFTVTLTPSGTTTVKYPFEMNSGNNWTINEYKIDPGQYTINEINNPEGFRLASFRIDGKQVANGGSISVKNGDKISVDVNNTTSQVIEIHKTVNGITPATGSFEVRLTRVGSGSPSTYTFTLTNKNQFSAELEVTEGTYTIQERNIPSGYWFDGFYIDKNDGTEELLSGNTITVGPKQDISLRVNNVTSTVEVQKYVDGARPTTNLSGFIVTLTKLGSSSPAYTFNLQYNSDISKRYINRMNVEPGDYRINETSIPKDYQFDSFLLIDSEGAEKRYANGDIITIQPGDSLTALTNNSNITIPKEQRADVKIRKVIDGVFASAVTVGSRAFTVDMISNTPGGPSYTFNLNNANNWIDNIQTVTPGTYTLSERSASGFQFVSFLKNGVVIPGNRIDLNGGDAIEMYVNNTPTAPVTTGASSIEIRKTIDGQPATAENTRNRTFTIDLTSTAVGGKTYTFTLNGADHWTDEKNLDPGEYTLRERNVSGFKLVSFVNQGQVLVDNIVNIGSGDSLEIIVDNTPAPTGGEPPDDGGYGGGGEPPPPPPPPGGGETTTKEGDDDDDADADSDADADGDGDGGGDGDGDGEGDGEGD